MRITPNMPTVNGYQTNWSLVWLDAKKRKNIMEKSFSFGKYSWWQGFCLGYHMVLSFLGRAGIRTPTLNHGGDVQVVFFVDIGEARSLAEGFLWAPPLVIKAMLAAAGFTEQIWSAPPWQRSSWILGFTSSEDKNVICKNRGEWTGHCSILWY